MITEQQVEDKLSENEKLFLKAGVIQPEAFYMSAATQFLRILLSIANSLEEIKNER